MATDLNFGFDWDGFRQSMEQHGLESGKAQFELFKTGPVEGLKETLKETAFHGYDDVVSEAKLKGLIVCNEQSEDVLVETLEAADQKLILVTDATAFYGESGGQVGDSGLIENENGTFIVEDTQKDGDLFLHYGYLKSGALLPEKPFKLKSIRSVEMAFDVLTRLLIFCTMLYKTPLARTHSNKVLK